MPNQNAVRHILWLFFILIPMRACAGAGDWAILYFLLITFPAGCLNFILLFIFMANGKYKNRKFALGHTFLSAIMPIAGIIISFLDSLKIVEEKTFILNIGGLLFSFLPLLIHRQSQHED